MTSLSSSDLSDKQPVCPQCGELLECKGRIVDTGRYKKWTEEWRCRTHGKIEISQRTSATAK